MDLALRNKFLKSWGKYFNDPELPIVFFYTDDPGDIARANHPKGSSCIICELAVVRNGKSLAWNINSLACGGARRYFGYTQQMRPEFKSFLSTGIPGKVEGERYLRTPEMVGELLGNIRWFPAKGKYIVFKRFDQLTPEEDPLAVIFFAKPDVLSGLFTLANFDQVMGDGVIAPFGSGCGIIVYQAMMESEKENPRAILGMFDPSARSCVPKDTLSFTIPMKKFERMTGYIEESFLITETWQGVKKRL